MVGARSIFENVMLLNFGADARVSVFVQCRLRTEVHHSRPTRLFLIVRALRASLVINFDVTPFEFLCRLRQSSGVLHRVAMRLCRPQLGLVLTVIVRFVGARILSFSEPTDE